MRKFRCSVCGKETEGIITTRGGPESARRWVRMPECCGKPMIEILDDYD
ncbi:MAG: hypothetical protein ACFFBD_25635 [Candidatus Hodarchaeota archaeon]